MRAPRFRIAATTLAIATWASGAWADVTVAVDAAADTHAISPLIYGVNFPTAAQLATKTVTVMRRGGLMAFRENCVAKSVGFFPRQWPAKS